MRISPARSAKFTSIWPNGRRYLADPSRNVTPAVSLRLSYAAGMVWSVNGASPDTAASPGSGASADAFGIDAFTLDDRLRLFHFAAAEKRHEYLWLLRAFDRARANYQVLMHASDARAPTVARCTCSSRGDWSRHREPPALDPST